MQTIDERQLCSGENSPSVGGLKTFRAPKITLPRRFYENFVAGVKIENNLKVTQDDKYINNCKVENMKDETENKLASIDKANQLILQKDAFEAGEQMQNRINPQVLNTGNNLCYDIDIQNKSNYGIVENFIVDFTENEKTGLKEYKTIITKGNSLTKLPSLNSFSISDNSEQYNTVREPLSSTSNEATFLSPNMSNSSDQTFQKSNKKVSEKLTPISSRFSITDSSVISNSMISEKSSSVSSSSLYSNSSSSSEAESSRTNSVSCSESVNYKKLTSSSLDSSKTNSSWTSTTISSETESNKNQKNKKSNVSSILASDGPTSSKLSLKTSSASIISSESESNFMQKMSASKIGLTLNQSEQKLKNTETPNISTDLMKMNQMSIIVKENEKFKSNENETLVLISDPAHKGKITVVGNPTIKEKGYNPLKKSICSGDLFLFNF